MADNTIQCTTLIRGATWTGLAQATQLGSDALVIERSISPGWEFINALRPGLCWSSPLHHALTRTLQERMFSRNLLTSTGLLHLPPLNPLLCELIKEHSLNVLFLTDIVALQPSTSGYTVQLITPSGLQSIQVQHIIDTTPHPLIPSTVSNPPASTQATSQPTIKHINALLHNEQANEQPDTPFPTLTTHEHGTIIPGRFPSEAYLQLTIKPHDDWPTARHKLHHYWQHRPTSWHDWTIAATADMFDIRTLPGPYHLADNYTHLPSSAYNNPLLAFDASLSLPLA